MSGKPTVLLALDLGARACKAMLVRQDGSILADYVEPCALESQQAGWSEQDPEVIWAAARAAIRSLTANEAAKIAGIVLSASMYSLMAVDAHGRPVTRLLTWADHRATTQADRLVHEQRAGALHNRTGSPVSPASPLCKLMWLQDNEPDNVAAAAKFVSIKEYVLHKLCGQWLVDHATACSTGLFNLGTMNWDEEAVRLAGITPARLAQPVPTTHVVRLLRAEAVEQLELEKEMPVIVGATDGTLTGLGLGAAKGGVLALALGSGAAVRAVCSQPPQDLRGRFFCHALLDREWILGGSLNNGGSALQWQSLVLGLPSVAALLDDAAFIEPGAEGLFMLPLLSGEQYAAFHPEAAALMLGLTRKHARSHLARAATEGVLYLIARMLADLEPFSGPVREIRIGGGMAESALLRQMLSDVLGRRVVLPASTEASTLGAAWLGFRALGYDRDWSRAITFPSQAVNEPDVSRHAFYKEWRARCDTLYRQHGALA